MKNFVFLVVIASILFASSCAPKRGVLRSPDYKGNVGSNDAKIPKEIDDEETAKDNTAEVGKRSAKYIGRNISLVLPFQLHQISGESLMDADIKRSALALDFYQGFQLGLDELAGKGSNFYVNVLDSKDDDFQNATLAQSEDVREASLIVGPVYPKEIKTFGANLVNKEILQINPLAATMPTEFNLPNLVSLTPPIRSHINAIALEVARQYTPGDIVIIYNTSDADGKQFLNGMLSAIKQAKPAAEIHSVSSTAQMNEKLSATGANLIVTGTTDKFQIKTLLGNLDLKVKEGYYSFKLFGHPLWSRYDFDVYPSFSTYMPTITSESHLRNWSTKAKAFREAYYAQFGVNPSDNSYKGYDAAIYFGGLIDKYNKNLQDHLIKEPFSGLYSAYKFKHNDTWGFSNDAVSIQVYTGNSFDLR
ncbi:hypothetical protein FAZ15_04360 [Sphingobacterium olei]|uniref:Amino acid ABC transporter substrate-binding protein n=1 Tax=Sphingobacterium olei TaxID=2571155 RepID=A0A4U0P7S7_9SPHI|nr:hypothetical protein [Sphingobacterium olei]TJZ63581.1 hypothetical protein FAZ15_04360 [Sphingobacterium olei]